MRQRPNHIGPYRIEEELGRGGMGVVYLGRDTRLGRKVAIKALPEDFERDAERLANLEKEAKALGALNHPNVALIYGLEEGEGTKFLVMEYVEGDDLSVRLKSGPVALDEALEICRQIAEGMGAAHEAGIVHRDLKPGNVKLTPQGIVKILDFGLAIPLKPENGPACDTTQSHTMTYGAIGEGLAQGTAAYMSPEQARGRRVDRRADLWALGCILFEVLTGKQAFGAETISDTFAAVLRGEPEWGLLPPQTPPAARRLLKRCLEKDPKKRVRDASDAAIELEEALLTLQEGSGARNGAGAQAPRRRVRGAVVAAACVCLVAGLALGRWALGSRAGASLPLRGAKVSVTIPRDMAVAGGRLSPDGQVMAILGRQRGKTGEREAAKGALSLYVRRLDAFGLAKLKGTEGATLPAFSPDSRWIAFVAPESPGSARNGIWRVPADGSAPPVAVNEWRSGWNDFTWLKSGELLVSEIPGTKFWRVPASGGSAPKELPVRDPMPGTVNFQCMHELPDGQGVLAGRVAYGPRGFVMDTVLLDPGSGRVTDLIEDAGFAQYAEPGYIFFSRKDNLLAVSFDLSSKKTKGGLTGIMDGLRTPSSWSPARFDFATNGLLAFLPGTRVGTQRQIVAAKPGEEPVAIFEERKPFNGQIAVSPDGKRLAAGVTREGGLDEIWVSDANGTSLHRLAFLPDADVDDPLWSPDGKQLIFTRTSRSGKDGLYQIRADGADEPHPLVTANSGQKVYDATTWTPDGSTILVQETEVPKGETRIVRIELSSSGGDPATPQVILALGKICRLPKLSPDGKTLAFTSNISGQYQVYVCTYGQGGLLGSPLPVAEGAGYNAIWAPDGKSLLYSDEANHLYSVAVAEGSGPAGTPRLVFDGEEAGVADATGQFQWLGDGRLIWVGKGAGEGDVTEIGLVLNCVQEFRGKAPVEAQ